MTKPLRAFRILPFIALSLAIAALPRARAGNTEQSSDNNVAKFNQWSDYDLGVRMKALGWSEEQIKASQLKVRFWEHANESGQKCFDKEYPIDGAQDEEKISWTRNAAVAALANLAQKFGPRNQSLLAIREIRICSFHRLPKIFAGAKATVFDRFLENKTDGLEAVMEPGVLWIGVKRLNSGWDDFWGHLDWAKIISAYEDGVAFQNLFPAGKAQLGARVLWPYLNPLSDKRLKLLAGLERKLQLLTVQATKVEKLESIEESEALEKLVLEEILGQRLEESPQNFLQSLGADERAEFFALWRAKLKDPKFASRFLDSVATGSFEEGRKVTKSLKGAPLNIEIKELDSPALDIKSLEIQAAKGIVVSNDHSISVQAQAGGLRIADYMSDVKISAEHNVEIEGSVIADTNDFVKVFFNVLDPNARKDSKILASLAFEEAYLEFMGSRVEKR
ncbi:MAG TPA: hypothetical protein VM901_05700 [Bdellovibrionota bacterium]|jgi:hypothetical protein|nr:hypothetical protein [Bdellovibrionota bacterium]